MIDEKVNLLISSKSLVKDKFQAVIAKVRKLRKSFSFLLVVICVFLTIAVNIKEELFAKENMITNILPVSYAAESNSYSIQGGYDFSVIDGKVFKKTNNSMTELNFNEGLLDKKTGLFYYTIKSTSSWGSEEYIYIYSTLKKSLIDKILFDNSGYYKFPIAISPNSKILALAERAQSVGETNILLIDLENGKTIEKYSHFHSPSLVWIDEESFIYLTTKKECKKDFCIQIGIDLAYNNIKTKQQKAKKIVEKNTDGNLPIIDQIQIKNDKIVLSSRLSSNNINSKAEYLVDLSF